MIKKRLFESIHVFMNNDTETCLKYIVFKYEYFELHKLRTIIQQYIPQNRKQNYYPHYFYADDVMFCRAELHTIQSKEYIEHYHNMYGNPEMHNIWCNCQICRNRVCVFV